MADFTLDDIELFLSSFPGFTKSEENGSAIISGTASIEADGNNYQFEIKICSSEKYPFRFPRVFELSNKIKKIPDWHINSDNSFCLTVEPIEAIACKDGISLSVFYSKWIIPYLSNQQYRINEGKYANGEYSHSIEGIFEYYSELLKTKDIIKIVEYLRFVFNNKKIERTSLCYCGSGSKFRHCHKAATVKLWESGEDVLAKHLTLFITIISKFN